MRVFSGPHTPLRVRAGQSLVSTLWILLLEPRQSGSSIYRAADFLGGLFSQTTVWGQGDCPRIPSWPPIHRDVSTDSRRLPSFLGLLTLVVSRNVLMPGGYQRQCQSSPHVCKCSSPSAFSISSGSCSASPGMERGSFGLLWSVQRVTWPTAGSNMSAQRQLAACVWLTGTPNSC